MKLIPILLTLISAHIFAKTIVCSPMTVLESGQVIINSDLVIRYDSKVDREFKGQPILYRKNKNGEHKFFINPEVYIEDKGEITVYQRRVDGVHDLALFYGKRIPSFENLRPLTLPTETTFTELSTIGTVVSIPNKDDEKIGYELTLRENDTQGILSTAPKYSLIVSQMGEGVNIFTLDCFERDAEKEYVFRPNL